MFEISWVGHRTNQLRLFQPSLKVGLTATKIRKKKNWGSGFEIHSEFNIVQKNCRGKI